MDLESTTTAPYVSGSDTSRDAAQSLINDLGRLELLVFTLVQRAGILGMTDDELEEKSQLAHQTISARRRELVLKGRVRDSGVRRQTRSGRKATVWVLGQEPEPSPGQASKSDGATVAAAYRRGLARALQVVEERGASHTNLMDKLEAGACARAIQALIEAS